MQHIQSSFRDPSGKVFKYKGDIYRGISLVYKDDFELFIKSGLYDELCEKSLIVSHESSKLNIDGFYKIIKPKLIPFISYPYEWSFSQYKDVALLTIRIAKLALTKGMVLKDASAYNVQFVGPNPIFIDTLSFEKYEDGKPWVAYKQFCQHFLAPLALASLVDHRMLLEMRNFIDGIPLDLTSRLLQGRSRFNLLLNIHIHYHNKAQQKFSDKPQVKTTRTANFSKMAFLAMLNSLETVILSLKSPFKQTEWEKYYDNTNYSDKATKHKKSIVKDFTQKAKPKSVWDLGANNGQYSRIASDYGAQTVAFDIDHNAIEKGYLHEKSIGGNIQFLIEDLTNPSPAIGWANAERDTLVSRSPADMIYALALIHHLAISNNLPLGMIAEYFSKLGEYLIIEFVPKSDSKVEILLSSRKDIFPEYNQEGFEKAFAKYFKTVSKKDVIGSRRTIYLMRRKDS